MNKKKVIAVIDAVLLVAAFIMLVFGKIHYLTFLIVAGITGLFAYKILPRMK